MKVLLTMLMMLAVPFAQASDKKAAATAEKAKEHEEGFKLVRADDLDKWLQKPGAVHVYDVNKDDLRSKEGLVPGAIPVAMKLDVSVLPKDKNAKLVFYCADERCMASHRAAGIAAKAGYKDVNVMADGILGWKKSGKTSQPFKG